MLSLLRDCELQFLSRDTFLRQDTRPPTIARSAVRAKYKKELIEAILCREDCFSDKQLKSFKAPVLPGENGKRKIEDTIDSDLSHSAKL